MPRTATAYLQEQRKCQTNNFGVGEEDIVPVAAAKGGPGKRCKWPKKPLDKASRKRRLSIIRVDHIGVKLLLERGVITGRLLASRNFGSHCCGGLRCDRE